MSRRKQSMVNRLSPAWAVIGGALFLLALTAPVGIMIFSERLGGPPAPLGPLDGALTEDDRRGQVDPATQRRLIRKLSQARIEPGLGIGPIRLDMTIADLALDLPPETVRAFGSDAAGETQSHILTVADASLKIESRPATGAIYSITLSMSACPARAADAPERERLPMTGRGLSLGSHLSRVQALLGQPAAVRASSGGDTGQSWHYPGIDFGFCPGSQVVRSIQVTPLEPDTPLSVATAGPVDVVTAVRHDDLSVAPAGEPLADAPRAGTNVAATAPDRHLQRGPDRDLLAVLPPAGIAPAGPQPGSPAAGAGDPAGTLRIAPGQPFQPSLDPPEGTAPAPPRPRALAAPTAPIDGPDPLRDRPINGPQTPPARQIDRAAPVQRPAPDAGPAVALVTPSRLVKAPLTEKRTVTVPPAERRPPAASEPLRPRAAQKAMSDRARPLVPGTIRPVMAGPDPRPPALRPVGDLQPALRVPPWLPDPVSVAADAEAALALSLVERRRIQRRLQLLDYDPLGIDGVFGPNTRRALTRFQEDSGLPATGFLDEVTVAELTERSAKKYARWERRRTRRRAAAAAQTRSREPRESTLPPKTATVPAARRATACARDPYGTIVQNQSFRCDLMILSESMPARLVQRIMGN